MQCREHFGGLGCVGHEREKLGGLGSVGHERENLGGLGSVGHEREKNGGLGSVSNATGIEMGEKPSNPKRRKTLDLNTFDLKAELNCSDWDGENLVSSGTNPTCGGTHASGRVHI